MLVALLQGVSFATAPLLSIGPFKIFVISHALREGWRRALPLSLVPLLADIPIVLFLWLVLRQLPGWTVDVLRVTGGLFYGYLAYGLIRSARRPAREAGLQSSNSKTFWQAITAIWVTPNVYINWSIIGVPALLAYAEQSTVQVIAFVAGFYLVFVVGLALQIFVAGQAGKISSQANIYLIAAAALFLFGFGIYQSWLGLTSLLR